MEAGAPPISAGATPGTPVLGVARRRVGEDLIRYGLMAATALSVVTTLGIVVALLRETVGFFEEVGVAEFLFGTEWSQLFKDPQFGVLPLVTGTLLVTAIALLVAIPLGLGAAVYLAEYAKPRTRRMLKPALERRYINTHFGIGYRFAPEPADGAEIVVPAVEAHLRAADAHAPTPEGITTA